MDSCRPGCRDWEGKFKLRHQSWLHESMSRCFTYKITLQTASVPSWYLEIVTSRGALEICAECVIVRHCRYDSRLNARCHGTGRCECSTGQPGARACWCMLGWIPPAKHCIGVGATMCKIEQKSKSCCKNTILLFLSRLTLSQRNARKRIYA